jgi:hypothetical protein
MKEQAQSENLKAKLSSSYVRLAAGSAVVIPMAVFFGGLKLSNHNETVIRG